MALRKDRKLGLARSEWTARACPDTRTLLSPLAQDASAVVCIELAFALGRLGAATEGEHDPYVQAGSTPAARATQSPAGMTSKRQRRRRELLHEEAI